MAIGGDREGSSVAVIYKATRTRTAISLVPQRGLTGAVDNGRATEGPAPQKPVDLPSRLCKLSAAPRVLLLPLLHHCLDADNPDLVILPTAHLLGLAWHRRIPQSEVPARLFCAGRVDLSIKRAPVIRPEPTRDILPPLSPSVHPKYTHRDPRRTTACLFAFAYSGCYSSHELSLPTFFPFNFRSSAPFPHLTSEATEPLRGVQYVNWGLPLIFRPLVSCRLRPFKDHIYLASVLYT